MTVHTRLLFVIADAEHVRFVRPAEADHTLHSYSRVIPGEGHHGGAHHAHEAAKDKFPLWVATQLNEDAASFDGLVVVAPSPRLAAIKGHLSHNAAAKLIGSLDKDLAHVPDHDLWPHLHEWVRPVHREPLL